MRLTKERFGGLLFLLLSLAYGYHATQIPGYPGDEYEPFTASTLPCTTSAGNLHRAHSPP